MSAWTISWLGGRRCGAVSTHGVRCGVRRLFGEKSVFVEGGHLYDQDVADGVLHDFARHGSDELALTCAESTVSDDDEVRRVLVAEIKDALGSNPPVVVRPSVKQGNRAKVLIEQAQGADLLVVGTRGDGGFGGLVLGSTSQHVAGYAKCSVAIVR